MDSDSPIAKRIAADHRDYSGALATFFGTKTEPTFLPRSRGVRCCVDASDAPGGYRVSTGRERAR